MEASDFQEKMLSELKALNRSQSELVALLGVFVQSEIEKRLAHIFPVNAQLLAYKLSDGTKTSTEIGAIVNVSQRTVSRWWQQWEQEYGIVETSGYKNPYKAKYSLSELAMIFGKIGDVSGDEVQKE